MRRLRGGENQGSKELTKSSMFSFFEPDLFLLEEFASMRFFGIIKYSKRVIDCP